MEITKEQVDFICKWEEMLKSLGNGSTSLAFKYDDAGVRTEKTVNGVTMKYTLYRDKISFETKDQTRFT